MAAFSLTRESVISVQDENNTSFTYGTFKGIVQQVAAEELNTICGPVKSAINPYNKSVLLI